MNRYIAIILFAFLLGFAACTEDDLSGRNNVTGKDINITAVRPQDGPATKAVKETFAKDDIIHVSATFTHADTKPATTTYACMQYDGMQWTAINSTTLTWPEGAVSGTFTSYYFPSSSALTVGKDNPHSLAEFTDEDNPLRATLTNVSAGAAVYLQFEHLCTKLTLNDLKDDDGNSLPADKELWLTKSNISNGCVLTRNTKDELEFKFTSGAENRISVKSTSGSAVFFLEEGDYKEMKLTFRNNKPYLTFNIKELSELKQGKHYTLSVTNLPGSVISGGLKEEQYWTNGEEGGFIALKDINAFLNAIKTGQEPYIEDGVTILDVLVVGGVKTVMQLRNVSFGSKGFIPVDVESGIVFDANYHTIKDVVIKNQISNGAAIFGVYEGTIMNLALENVTTATNLSAQNVGALIGEAKSTSKLINIKLKEKNTINASTMTGDVFIGGLVGKMSGSADKIEISGNLTVGVSGETDANIFIGGLVGNTSGTITNSSVNCEKATVENECTGTSGTLYTGGLAGYSLMKLQYCSTMADVNASTAMNNITYTGGLVGRADKEIDGCDASGTVKGASSASVGADSPGESFTGGCIGEYTGDPTHGLINNCQSIGSVTAGKATGDHASAVTGGLIGRVSLANNNKAEIRNCGYLGKVEDATGSAYTGGLIGKGEKKSDAASPITVNNSFCMNAAIDFIGDNAASVVTIENSHMNDSYMGTGTTGTTLEKLKAGQASHNIDWFEWTSSASLFGGKPYLIRK